MKKTFLIVKLIIVIIGFNLSNEIFANPIKVSGVDLDSDSIIIAIGADTTLIATIQPDSAENYEFLWHVLDSGIVSITEGKLVGLREGETTIVVEVKDEGYRDSCYINVIRIPVSDIVLSTYDVELELGEDTVILAEVLPDKATNKNIIWESLNPYILSVNNGKVSAIAEGTNFIIAKSEDGEVITACKVKVIIPESGISLSSDTLLVRTGFDTNLKVIIEPMDATYKLVTWSVQDPEIVTITNGIISGNKEGETKIIANSYSGKYADTCVVIVKESKKSTSVLGHKEIKSKIYPNPANNYITVEVENLTNFGVKLADIQGKLVLSNERFTNGSRINITQLKQGLYILEIIIGQQSYFSKIIVN